MLKHILDLLIPSGQRAPLADVATPQVANHAGGFVWAVDAWQRLARFLVLGSDRGTYYVTPRQLAIEQADAVLRCLDLDGPRAVQVIRDVSHAGRAPRNDAAIFALALALKLGDAPTRAAAAEAVPAVCRTGTHLLQLADAVERLGGWGRGTRRVFARALSGPVDRVAFQAMKYAQRDGWSQRDLLRKAHPRPPSEAHDALYRWIARGEASPVITADGPLSQLWAAIEITRVDTVARVIELVRRHRLPREVIPTRWLGDPEVWRAMIDQGMPGTALLRNLGVMTANRALDDGGVRDRVVRTLVDGDLRRARVHPLSILVALEAYKAGKGARGQTTWTPHRRIVEALDAAFYAAFEPNEDGPGRRMMLAVDVSGSMGWTTIAGMTGITPRIGAAAMAMVTRRRAASCHVVAFSHQLTRVDLDRATRLDEALKTFAAIPMGATDCALPMQYARKASIPIDAFVVYTDSETWHGKQHPRDALRDYRQATGIPAKLIVVGMVSNGFTIADPDDAGMLDVVGFDTAAPTVIDDFAAAA